MFIVHIDPPSPIRDYIIYEQPLIGRIPSRQIFLYPPIIPGKYPIYEILSPIFSIQRQRGKYGNGKVPKQIFHFVVNSRGVEVNATCSVVRF